MPSIVDALCDAALIVGVVALGIYFLRKWELRPDAWNAPHEHPATPDDFDKLLVRNCQEFERSVRENPRDAFALKGWGKALEALAASKSGDEAEGLYSQADEKYSAALAITPGDIALTANLARMLSLRAVRKGGDKGRRLLIRACGLCERMAAHPESNPTRARDLHRIAYHLWGTALLRLGWITGYDEADRFYAEAGEKYSAALAVDPGHREPALGRALSLRLRALQNPGEAGRLFLVQARDAYEEIVKKDPSDVRGLEGWGRSLLLMGLRAPDAEAHRLHLQAEEKLSMGLATAPGDDLLLSNLASVMTQRAGLREGEEGNDILEKASQMVEAALREHPAHYTLLSVWGYTLNLRAERMPSSETDRLIGEAAVLFDEASQQPSSPNAILCGWGILLSAKAWRAAGAESVRLLQEARKKFAEADARAPGFAAFELAEVSARLGEPDECRKWLEKSREPGIQISADCMARDPALVSVRECDWFRQLLAK